MFVFPQFYGSFYVECARNLWKAVSRMNLKLVDGTPLIEHLAKQGITEMGACEVGVDPVSGTFEAHIRDVENLFWKQRFKVYDNWKKRWYEDYTKKGYFESLTGFRFSGYYRRNEVINYAVQGSAFHCLLRSLIDLDNEIIKRKMDSKIIGQIHDSVVSLVKEDELQDYLNMIQPIMTTNLRKQWKWINVPIEVEIEVTPSGGSWKEKKEWIKKDNKWEEK